MITKQHFLPALALLLGLAFGATLTGFLINDAKEAQNIIVDTATTSIPNGEQVATSTPLPEIPDVSIPTDSEDPDTPVSSPDDDMIACTMDAKLCPDGKTYVGRVAPSCAFAACPGETPTTQKEVVCTPLQKKADACIEIYAPVCASVQVECITAPCYPVKQTYPNSCYACKEDRVISYVDGGACPGDPVSE